ncbi:MAG: hypothetical protein KY443_04665 [Actinobacteria bacterium]|nr:hypothetical protein [Actinomycetota bacterium]
MTGPSTRGALFALWQADCAEFVRREQFRLGIECDNQAHAEDAGVLPDALYEQLKARGLPASELLQQALAAEIRRQDLLAETDHCVEAPAREVGQPSARETARAPRGPHQARRRMIVALREAGLWPPVVPSVVLVESLTGDSGRDAITNGFLKTCDIDESVPLALARRAARLRAQARRRSAVDAIVVATAEPNGVVLTGGVDDLVASAAHASGVAVERP